ncbi:hypothetical protein KFL_001450020 [Klebsormidium nitens]|uniref:Uncharacterized protein n=1 Tax=Klebsormidium nitens TaxID=105231 RepID=A0A1Y1I1N3_KLENI|nr:hypothetical protein KFL_001450020 [Klebsormidium nitens]|eukprot:GAQ83349.1 hypothetical protein KFL_001450020 [Klebsormidium nitens]
MGAPRRRSLAGQTVSVAVSESGVLDETAVQEKQTRPQLGISVALATSLTIFALLVILAYFTKPEHTKLEEGQLLRESRLAGGETDGAQRRELRMRLSGNVEGLGHQLAANPVVNDLLGGGSSSGIAAPIDATLTQVNQGSVEDAEKGMVKEALVDLTLPPTFETNFASGETPSAMLPNKILDLFTDQPAGYIPGELLPQSYVPGGAVPNLFNLPPFPLYTPPAKSLASRLAEALHGSSDVPSSLKAQAAMLILEQFIPKRLSDLPLFHGQSVKIPGLPAVSLPKLDVESIYTLVVKAQEAREDLLGFVIQETLARVLPIENYRSIITAVECSAEQMVVHALDTTPLLSWPVGALLIGDSEWGCANFTGGSGPFYRAIKSVATAAGNSVIITFEKDATHILRDLNLPDPSQAVGPAAAVARELLHCTTQAFDALPIDFDKLASECSVVESDCLAGAIPLGARCASAIQSAAYAAAGPASTLVGVAKCAQVVTAVLAQEHAGRLFTEGAVMGCGVLQNAFAPGNDSLSQCISGFNFTALDETQYAQHARACQDDSSAATCCASVQAVASKLLAANPEQASAVLTDAVLSEGCTHALKVRMGLTNQSLEHCSAVFPTIETLLEGIQCAGKSAAQVAKTFDAGKIAVACAPLAGASASCGEEIAKAAKELAGGDSSEGCEAAVVMNLFANHFDVAFFALAQVPGAATIGASLPWLNQLKDQVAQIPYTVSSFPSLYKAALGDLSQTLNLKTLSDALAGWDSADVRTLSAAFARVPAPLRSAAAARIARALNRGTGFASAAYSIALDAQALAGLIAGYPTLPNGLPNLRLSPETLLLLAPFLPNRMPAMAEEGLPLNPEILTALSEAYHSLPHGLPALTVDAVTMGFLSGYLPNLPLELLSGSVPPLLFGEVFLAEVLKTGLPNLDHNQIADFLKKALPNLPVEPETLMEMAKEQFPNGVNPKTIRSLLTKKLSSVEAFQIAPTELSNVVTANLPMLPFDVERLDGLLGTLFPEGIINVTTLRKLATRASQMDRAELIQAISSRLPEGSITTRQLADLTAEKLPMLKVDGPKLADVLATFFPDGQINRTSIGILLREKLLTADVSPKELIARARAYMARAGGRVTPETLQTFLGTHLPFVGLGSTELQTLAQTLSQTLLPALTLAQTLSEALSLTANTAKDVALYETEVLIALQMLVYMPEIIHANTAFPGGMGALPLLYLPLLVLGPANVLPHLGATEGLFKVLDGLSGILTPHPSAPHFDCCPLDFSIPGSVYTDLSTNCQSGSDAYDVYSCCGAVRLAFLKVLEANAAILPPEVSSRALADACGAGFKAHLTGLYKYDLGDPTLSLDEFCAPVAGFGIIPDLNVAVEALFSDCPHRDLASVALAADLGALTGPCQDACAGDYSHNDPEEVSAHWKACNAAIWEHADALAGEESAAARAACAGVVRARLEQAYFGSLFNSTVTDCGSVFEGTPLAPYQSPPLFMPPPSVTPTPTEPSPKPAISPSPEPSPSAHPSPSPSPLSRATPVPTKTPAPLVATVTMGMALIGAAAEEFDDASKEKFISSFAVAQKLDPSAVKVTSVSFRVSQSVSLDGISFNEWNTVGSSAFIKSIATASNVSISAVHVDGLDVSDRRRLLSADVTPDGRQLLASGQFTVRFSINCTQPDQAVNVANSVTQVLNTGGVAAALAAQNLHPSVTIVDAPHVAVALTIEVVVAVADQAAAAALAAAMQTSVDDGTLQRVLVFYGIYADVVITQPPFTAIEGTPRPPPPPSDEVPVAQIVKAGSNTGLIAGIVAGCAVGAVLVASATAYFIRRRNQIFDQHMPRPVRLVI